MDYILKICYFKKNKKMGIDKKENIESDIKESDLDESNIDESNIDESNIDESILPIENQIKLQKEILKEINKNKILKKKNIDDKIEENVRKIMDEIYKKNKDKLDIIGVPEWIEKKIYNNLVIVVTFLFKEVLENSDINFMGNKIKFNMDPNN